MTGRPSGVSAAFVLALALTGGAAQAATKEAAKDATSSSPVQILPGTGSKEPITIDADKLVYFDKEKKAIYSGNVIVVQGDTKMTSSVMTVISNSPTPTRTRRPQAANPPTRGAGPQGRGRARAV